MKRILCVYTGRPGLRFNNVLTNSIALFPRGANVCGSLLMRCQPIAGKLVFRVAATVVGDR